MKVHLPWFLLALAVTPALAGASGAAPKPVLPFIQDDYPRARAEARAKKLPIFIEAWAPW
jgi:hypothetical protein